MSAVWKFPLRLSGGEQLVRTMPFGAIPVRFAMQGQDPTLWCLVDERNSAQDRRFVVVGTGHPIPDGCEYIGSCDDGPYVWHAFECCTPNGPEGQS
jgi:hypothetical protein